MDEVPYPRDTDEERFRGDPAGEEPVTEPSAEPESGDAAESSFDLPGDDVEESLAAEPIGQDEQMSEPAQEVEQEPEPVAQDVQEPEPVAHDEPSTPPELALEPEPESEPAAQNLTLDDMVAEITQSQGTEAGLVPETAEGEDVGEGTGAEGAESGAAGTEAAAEEAAEGAGEQGQESAPEPSEEAAEGEAAVSGLARQSLRTRLPFWIYGGVWIIFLGVMTYLIWPASVTTFTDSPLYAYLVLGGAALTVVGLFVGLFTWLGGRSGRSAEERQGLTQAITLRSAGWMAVGVALWWIVLMCLDLHRTGVIR